MPRSTLILLLALGACRSRETVAPAPVPRQAPRLDAGRDVQPRARPDIPSLMQVEWAEADVIRARRISAISIRAGEIRSPMIVRVRHYPTPKQMGWNRVEGHLVEVDTLSAHHVSARVIEADEIVVHKLERGARIAARPTAGGFVRNRIVAVDPATGRPRAD